MSEITTQSAYAAEPIYQEMDPSGTWSVIKKERYDAMLALGESCWVRVVAKEAGDDRQRKGETMDDVIERLADGEVMSDDRLDHLMLMMLARILIALLAAAPQPSPEKCFRCGHAAHSGSCVNVAPRSED